MKKCESISQFRSGKINCMQLKSLISCSYYKLFISEAVLKPINFAQEWVFQVIYSKELLGFTRGSAVQDHDLLVFGKLDSFGL